jgi:hypothetical protein
MLILIVCFTLMGCNGGKAEKGKVDIKGIITEVDHEGHKILVEDKDEGLVWVTLQKNGDISKYLGLIMEKVSGLMGLTHYQHGYSMKYSLVVFLVVQTTTALYYKLIKKKEPFSEKVKQGHLDP